MSMSVHIFLPALAWSPHWRACQRQYQRAPLPAVPGGLGSDLMPAVKEIRTMSFCQQGYIK